MSNPSRFDKVSLLTSTGGILFNQLLQPHYNTMQCDVRLTDDNSPFLPETKCVLLLGTVAMHKWCASETRDNTLNEMRGSPLHIGTIPALASYLPQDAADIQNYEGEYNELANAEEDDEDAGEEDGDEGDVKRFSHTKRSNYAFWLSRDIEKCKGILRQVDGKGDWIIEPQPVYKIYPPADEVISELSKYEDHYLEFDIETDYEGPNLLCFSFTFTNLTEQIVTIYSVPVLNNDYKWAYTALPFIIKALTVAIKKNILVCHNGSGFDFLVLGYKYHIPVYRVYDTLVAQHRIFPDIEKSLGHCVSMWTYQRFHKDTDSQAYFTHQHMMDKLRYCGKDVFTMWLVHKAQRAFAKTIPGLEASIECATNSIRPYVTTMIQGIRYDEAKLKAICKENDELMMQYIRIIKMLIGEVGIAECKKAVKSKNPSVFPSSNPQCVRYFYELLEYNHVGRRTDSGRLSLGKKNMYMLALKHPDNPVIMFTLLYRQVAKEYGSLRFVPWKDNDNKLIDYNKYVTDNAQ